MSIFMVVFTAIVYVVAFLLPAIVAYRNRRYKAVRTVSVLFIVMVISAFAGVIIGDETTIQTIASCICVSIWVISTFICWWFIYERKSFDFIPNAEDAEKILSPKMRKLLGLPPAS